MTNPTSITHELPHDPTITGGGGGGGKGGGGGGVRRKNWKSSSVRSTNLQRGRTAPVSLRQALKQERRSHVGRPGQHAVVQPQAQDLQMSRGPLGLSPLQGGDHGPGSGRARPCRAPAEQVSTHRRLTLQ